MYIFFILLIHYIHVSNCNFVDWHVKKKEEMILYTPNVQFHFCNVVHVYMPSKCLLLEAELLFLWVVLLKSYVCVLSNSMWLLWCFRFVSHFVSSSQILLLRSNLFVHPPLSPYCPLLLSTTSVFSFVDRFCFFLLLLSVLYAFHLSLLLSPPKVSSLLGDPSRLLMQKALSLRPPGLVPLGKGLLGDSPTGEQGWVSLLCTCQMIWCNHCI